MHLYVILSSAAGVAFVACCSGCTVLVVVVVVVVWMSLPRGTKKLVPVCILTLFALPVSSWFSSSEWVAADPQRSLCGAHEGVPNACRQWRRCGRRHTARRLHDTPCRGHSRACGGAPLGHPPRARLVSARRAQPHGVGRGHFQSSALRHGVSAQGPAPATQRQSSHGALICFLFFFFFFGFVCFCCCCGCASL